MRRCLIRLRLLRLAFRGRNFDCDYVELVVRLIALPVFRFRKGGLKLLVRRRWGLTLMVFRVRR